MVTGRVKALEGTNSEGSRLSSSGLGLGKKIVVVSFCPFLVNAPNWAQSRLEIRAGAAEAFIILFTYAIVSLPWMMGKIPFCWMGEGSLKPKA